MSGSLLAAIVIPIVVGAALAVWIFAVYRAYRHPGSGSGKMPRRAVIGGAFRVSGGRQVMPRRDAPAEPTREDDAAAEAVGSDDQESSGIRGAREAAERSRDGRPAGL